MFAVIAASHRDLATLIALHGFREDLYYRLNAMTVALRPLRERPGDVRALAHRGGARLRFGTASSAPP
jgi:transcriptional regulator with PAS, ATPase and Fis domain